MDANTKTRKVRGFGRPAYFGYFRTAQGWQHVLNEHGGKQLFDTWEAADRAAAEAHARSRLD